MRICRTCFEYWVHSLLRAKVALFSHYLFRPVRFIPARNVNETEFTLEQKNFYSAA